MARRKKQKQSEETLVDLVEVKDSASDFLEDNQKTILGVLAALIIVVGGYIFYNQFVQAPKEKDAATQIVQAQAMFEKDSFALALTNPGGGFMGFLDIIDEFGGTAVANSASYYAGISYLHLGQYDAAIDYLNSFDPEGTVLAYTKFGAIGDAYAEKNDFSSAISNYEKAANAGDNEVLASYYLKKVGLLHEKQGQFAEAKAAFQQIKNDYPTSQEGTDIDKYIARVEAKG
ncbi:MAG: tetratricopeptide repeat protein [Bacteroidota bacterium]